jgi:hypothetical protein
LFVWENNQAPAKNINSFLAMFGQDFKIYIENKVKESQEMQKGMENFLLLGFLRNNLVHDDFATNTVQGKTMKEIYDLFDLAVQFIDFVFEKLFVYKKCDTDFSK